MLVNSTTPALLSSHEFHLVHTYSNRSGCLLGAVGVIILVGSLLATSLGSLSFAVGVGGMVCGMGYILFSIYISLNSRKSLPQENTIPPLPHLLGLLLEPRLSTDRPILDENLLETPLCTLINSPSIINSNLRGEFGHAVNSSFTVKEGG